MADAVKEALEAEARRLDGLFVGMCEPEEYEHLLKAGVLVRVYEGTAGFMGLAKFRLAASVARAAEEGRDGQ